MTKQTKNVAVRNYLDIHKQEDFVQDVLPGLKAQPRQISSKYFYDAQGSELFEQICAQPEYYPTNTELSILQDISAYLHQDLCHKDIIELGSGSHHKMNRLLQRMSQAERETLRYIPFDISEKAVLNSAEALVASYPELSVLGIVGDFAWHLDKIPMDNPNYFFFLGGTIGNLSYSEMVSFIQRIRASMRTQDRIFIGFDLVKDVGILEQAYNDKAGVTAAFNKNILNVVNERTGSDFDPRLFEHVAFFNRPKERIEMHLRVLTHQSVFFPGEEGNGSAEVMHLAQGELIHTENSHKFTYAKIDCLAADSGMVVENRFNDNAEWFAVVEFRAK